MRQGVDKATAEKGKALFDQTIAGMTAGMEDFIAGRSKVVPPRSDVEGYTIEFLGTRLYYFWAETCQEYMEQFRPRFRNHWGYPYPGIELDNWGHPKPKS